MAGSATEDAGARVVVCEFAAGLPKTTGEVPSEQVLAPAVLFRPAGQLLHSTAPSAPYVPTAQMVQLLAPMLL